MARKVNLTTNHGFRWSFGADGLQDIEFKTQHGLGWDVSTKNIDLDTVVTNQGETVTVSGDPVTNGA